MSERLTEIPVMVVVTEKAAAEIKRAIASANKPETTALRVVLAGGGCSGFQYRIALEDNYDEAKDHLSEQHGLKIAVDKKSDLYLDGTRIDYYEGLDKRGFTFDNPNATKSCGCGSSFSV